MKTIRKKTEKCEIREGSSAEENGEGLGVDGSERVECGERQMLEGRYS